MGVIVSINEGQLAMARRLMDPRQLKQAMRSAVGKATREGRVALRKQVQEVLAVKTGAANQVITAKVSNVDGQPIGVIRVDKKSIPLIDFKPKVSKKKGVTVVLRKGRPPVRFRHAFKRTMRSGHVGIFERAKRGANVTPHGRAWRLPIDELTGVSVYAAMNVPAMLEKATATIAAALSKNFLAQYGRFGIARPVPATAATYPVAA